MKQKIIFISWHDLDRHSKLLAEAFSAQLYFVKGIIKTRKILWHLFFYVDYFIKSISTIKIIINKKPRIIIVQNPPSLLPILLAILKKILNFKLVVDSHNGAFEGIWAKIPFYAWALRNSKIVTIHNNQLLTKLSSDPKFTNVNFKILNSRLTNFSNLKKDQNVAPYILAVTTFANDEPVRVLLEGIVNYLNKAGLNIEFKLTGDYTKDPRLFLDFSKYAGIHFLGYLSDDLYNKYFINSQGIISLSTRDDVQQFALTEAVSAEIPFISNDNTTNKELFDNKVILTKITPIEISNNIEKFILSRKILKENIREIKYQWTDKWDKDFHNVKTELEL